jgi:hypothetical protein
VQELNAGNQVTADLLNGLRLDEYFTRTDTASSTFLADAFGSTIGLVGAGGTSLQITVYQPFGATRVGGSANANSYEFTILIDGRFPLGTTEDCSTGSSALPIVATRRGRRHALHLARHRLDQSSKTIIGCGVSSSRRMRVATKISKGTEKSRV